MCLRGWSRRYCRCMTSRRFRARATSRSRSAAGRARCLPDVGLKPAAATRTRDTSPCRRTPARDGDRWRRRRAPCGGVAVGQRASADDADAPRFAPGAVRIRSAPAVRAAPRSAPAPERHRPARLARAAGVSTSDFHRRPRRHCGGASPTAPRSSPRRGACTPARGRRPCRPQRVRRAASGSSRVRRSVHVCGRTSTRRSAPRRSSAARPPRPTWRGGPARSRAAPERARAADLHEEDELLEAGQRTLQSAVLARAERSRGGARVLQREAIPCDANPPSQLDNPRFLLDDGSPQPTLEACFEDTGRLRLGDPDHDAVTRVQQALVDLHYSVGTAGVDGKFGSDTAAALRQFEDHDLQPANYDDVGPRTMRCLNRLAPSSPLPGPRRPRLRRRRLPLRRPSPRPRCAGPTCRPS